MRSFVRPAYHRSTKNQIQIDIEIDMAVRKPLFSVTIKDCRVEAIASTGGGGGQNKNRRHTAIRITHIPSGAVGYSADENNQLRNKQDAFVRMAKTPAFQTWAKLIASELTTGKSLEQRVEDELTPDKLKVEVKDQEGRWTIARETDIV